ncbi:hypothetical protein ABCY62_02515 [Acetivibrio clariflavus]
MPPSFCIDEEMKNIDICGLRENIEKVFLKSAAKVKPSGCN